jgi:hypothetical protein
MTLIHDFRGDEKFKLFMGGISFDYRDGEAIAWLPPEFRVF